MEHRVLGRTGLSVSVLGFGGAPIGLQGYLGHDDRDAPAFRERALAALRTAVARGITYFDTAPGYGKGRSESRFGEALEPHRAQIVLGTKYWWDSKNFDTAHQTEDLRASLERLRTDHVDLLQLHGSLWTDAQAEALLAAGSVLDWADEMRARGSCRFTGLTSEGPTGALERLLRSRRFATVQVCYNLIYQSTCDYQREPAGIIPLAKSLGLGVLTMRGPTSGFLQRLCAAEFPEVETRRVTRAALKFVLSTPEVDCALVGMCAPEEVDENVSLAEDPRARFDLRALHDRYA